MKTYQEINSEVRFEIISVTSAFVTPILLSSIFAPKLLGLAMVIGGITSLCIWGVLRLISEIKEWWFKKD